MKVFIMGAGYAGMALLTHFQNRGYDIVVSTTQKDKVDELSSYAQDVLLLTRPRPFGKTFKTTLDQCDALIVLVAPKNGSSYRETYLETAQEIVEQLEGRDKPLYILYTGSTSVYEGCNEEWAEEDANLNPQSENAAVLYQTEKVYLSTPLVCVLRLGGIYGPHRELNSRAIRFSGQPMNSNGSETTNHIHRDDIVDAIEFCLTHRLTGIYNVVNDEHPTRKTLYNTLCQHAKIPEPIWEENSSSNKLKGYKVSNRKIKEAGFVVKKSVVA